MNKITYEQKQRARKVGMSIKAISKQKDAEKFEQRIKYKAQIKREYEVIEKYGLKSKGCYFGYKIKRNKLADQGMKLHISVMNKEDYINLYNKLVPILVRYNAVFKIVDPVCYQSIMTSNTQRGKCITLYASNWNAREFFKECESILLEDDLCGMPFISVPYEVPFGGRVYGRYGSNVKFTILNPVTGEEEIDVRTIAYPSFLDGITLEMFFEECEWAKEKATMKN